MKKTAVYLLVSVFSLAAYSQISEMNWEIDYQVYLKLANDSNYTYDIREAFHVTDVKNIQSSDFVFYPVNPGKDYVQKVQEATQSEKKYSTLWSALNGKIGGGWVHFTNCIAYALETEKVDLTSPLMKRPESNWKPNPVTDSYKRTKKWDYYIPYSQKNAQKEYAKRLSENNLGDLKSLPKSYIELFLNTGQKEYNNYKKEGKRNIVAKIDLVKVILGANYLGEAQINYMSNSILESVLAYSSNMLPTLIIFDEFGAAAAMSLDAEGYKIDHISFQRTLNLSEEEVQSRTKEINGIVAKINEYNSASFKKRLGNYYSKQ